MDKFIRNIWTSTPSSPFPSGNKRISQPAITIAAGNRKVIRFKAGLAEGRVCRVFVKQASGGGTSVGFQVRIQSTKETYGDDGTTAAYNAAVTGQVSLFDVIAPITATAGNAADLRYSQGGDPYQNDDAAGGTERESYLYLVIIPTAAPDQSTWDVAITTLSEG